jgi:hypothetical protein
VHKIDGHQQSAGLVAASGQATLFYLVKVRPGLLNLKPKDTFQTLATRDSFGPTVARLMSTHLLAG